MGSKRERNPNGSKSTCGIEQQDPSEEEIEAKYEAVEEPTGYTAKRVKRDEMKHMIPSKSSCSPFGDTSGWSL